MNAMKVASPLAFALVLSFLAFACSPPAPASAPDFVGVWVLGGGMSSETVVFSTTVMDLNDAGSVVGNLVATIDSYDTGAKQITATVVTSSGAYSSFTAGMKLYQAYSITGTLMYWDYSLVLPYPAASTGPYVKM